MLGFTELSYAAALMLAFLRIRRGSDKQAREAIIALMNGSEFEGLADGTKRC